MNKAEIYYFSGTGNSLHVAKELHKRVPNSTMIPIVNLLNEEAIHSNADLIAVVFPIYMAMAPLPIRKFFEKLEVLPTQNVFAIATRIGTTHNAFKEIDKLLKKKGKCLDGYFSFNMASNDPKFNYKVPTQSEIDALEKIVHTELDSLTDIILQQKKYREKDKNYLTKLPFLGLISSMSLLSEKFKDNLYADEKCTGCGICERVCLSEKIKLIDNKPVWQETIRCYKCSACLNYCPEQSVQIKSFTEKNGRYSHPYATIEDIEKQKISTI